MASHPGITKTVVLLLITVFAWQSSVTEALSAAVPGLSKPHKILEEHEITKQAVPTLPELASINVHQGLKYIDQGRWQEAIAAFSDDVPVNPSSAAAYFGLDVTYSNFENWKEALI